MSFALADTHLSRNAVLTTREAGQLVGRSEDAVRAAIRRGDLDAERGRDFWLVSASDVIAWAAHTPIGRGNPLPRPRTEEVVGLLTDWGSGSAEELATVLGVHVGNARKYLAILAAQGRAERSKDGQWTLKPPEVQLAS